MNYPHDPQIDCLEMATSCGLWVVGCGGRGGNSDIPIRMVRPTDSSRGLVIERAGAGMARAQVWRGRR